MTLGLTDWRTFAPSPVAEGPDGRLREDTRTFFNDCKLNAQVSTSLRDAALPSAGLTSDALRRAGCSRLMAWMPPPCRAGGSRPGCFGPSSCSSRSPSLSSRPRSSCARPPATDRSGWTPPGSTSTIRSWAGAWRHEPAPGSGALNMTWPCGSTPWDSGRTASTHPSRLRDPGASWPWATPSPSARGSRSRLPFRPSSSAGSAARR
jgi:hypothetical protein